MTKVNLGEFRVDVLSQDETIIEIKKEILKSYTPHILVTPNAGHLKGIATNKEIAEIYSLFPNSTFKVIQFDTEIQNEAVLEDNEVPLIRIGYGGTSLEPVQKHIELHTPKLAVIFTDYGCIPMTELNSSDTTLIWVIVDSSEIPELGKTIHLNTH